MAARLKIAYGPGTGTLKGLDKLNAKLSRYSDEARALIKAQLEASADELVGNIRAITPVAPTGYGDRPPGELRDSVHKEDGRFELSVFVIEDARAADGEFYGPHVEFGHKSKDGSHVSAEPHFFPAVRVAKRKMRAKVARAASKAIQQTVGAGGPSA